MLVVPVDMVCAICSDKIELTIELRHDGTLNRYGYNQPAGWTNIGSHYDFCPKPECQAKYNEATQKPLPQQVGSGGRI